MRVDHEKDKGKTWVPAWMSGLLTHSRSLAPMTGASVLFQRGKLPMDNVGRTTRGIGLCMCVPAGRQRERRNIKQKKSVTGKANGANFTGVIHKFQVNSAHFFNSF